MWFVELKIEFVDDCFSNFGSIAFYFIEWLGWIMCCSSLIAFFISSTVLLLYDKMLVATKKMQYEK